MSRRNAPFGGLFNVGFFLAVVLLCRARAQRGAESDGDIRSQGGFHLHVDPKKEFDRTVGAAKEVFDLSDHSHQEKPDRNICKNPNVNCVIGRSVPCLTNEQGEVPETAPEHGQLPSIKRDGRGRLVNREGVPIIEEDLYWSAEIDAATPKGFSEQELDEWKERISKQSVRSFEPGGLDKCGREKNHFIVLEDGSKLCARYRYPLITSMTGELYSNHLARMLGMTNLPPLHLSMATTNSSFWRGQGSNFHEAGWEDGKVVILTQWIEDLHRAFLPEMLVQGPLPVGALNHGLMNLTMTELTSLLQWSDLLLFDYLIGHFDRLTINLSGVKNYNDSSLMRSEVHNLVQHPQTKQLWIIDNESGLLDAYAFLLSSGSKDGELHGEFHEQLLRMTCVFRRSTVDGVRALLAHPEPAQLLTARVLKHDPVGRGVFPEYDQVHKYPAILRARLANIADWMNECQRKNAAARENSN